MTLEALDRKFRNTTGTYPEAMQRYRELGLPLQNSDTYRHFPLKSFLQHGLSLQHAFRVIESNDDTIVIENGHTFYLPQLPGIALKVSEGSEHYRHDHFDPLYHLSHALSSHTLHIRIEEDCTLRLRHCYGPGPFVPFRIFLSVAPGLQATVQETFEQHGDTDPSSLHLYGMDAVLSDVSHMQFIRYRHDDSAVTIGSHAVTMANRSALELSSFDFGAAESMHLVDVDLGRKATMTTRQLVTAGGAGHIGNIVHVSHKHPDAESSQNAYYILKENATGIYDGKVTVAEKATGTRAKQHCKSILLSPEGNPKMVGRPHLEIYTDNLEASHGMSIGSLDADALFYLRSRGISEDTARAMLVEAFAAEAIGSVKDTALQDALNRSLRSIL